MAGGFERRAQRVEDFGARAQGLGKGGGAYGHDHEFLEIDRIVGMHAAVDDVHHRHRQEPRGGAPDIAVERLPLRRSRGLGDRKRDAEDRVGAEPALVGRAVERDHGLVDLDLRLGVHPADRVEDFAVDRLDGVAHALAEIAFAAVAQLDGFVRAGRGARGHGGAAAGAVGKDDVDLYGRVAAAVENLAADDIDDGCHTRSPMARPRRLLQDRRGSGHVRHVWPQ